MSIIFSIHCELAGNRGGDGHVDVSISSSERVLFGQPRALLCPHIRQAKKVSILQELIVLYKIINDTRANVYACLTTIAYS